MGFFNRPPSSVNRYERDLVKMREAYRRGRYSQAYSLRAGYGYNVSEEDMDSRESWFWFNALGALGGIKAGLDPLSGYLAGYCGFATTTLNWDDPQQKAVVAEIERLAFPSRPSSETPARGVTVWDAEGLE